MNTSSIDTTVIIPNWNGEKWLPGCLNGLEKQVNKAFITMIVDNGSQDGSIDFVQKKYPWVHIISLPRNKGFAAAVNTGITECLTPYVILLNNDTIPDPNWFGSLHAYIVSSPPEVASVSSCMVTMDNPSFIDDAGDSLSWYGSAKKRGYNDPIKNFSVRTEVFSACAGAALYKTAALLQAGLFDEKYVSYLEDIDLGLRLQLLGYKSIYLPEAVVWHKGHGSSIQKETYVTYMTRNRVLLFLKNIPLSLLLIKSPLIAAGQVWYFFAYKKPVASIKGYLLCLLLIPHILKMHKFNRKKRKISLTHLMNIITDEKPE